MHGERAAGDKAGRLSGIDPRVNLCTASEGLLIHYVCQEWNSEKKLNARAKETELVLKIYDEVLRTSNYFLYNCKHWSITSLREEQPHYTELARIMRQAAGFIAVVANDDLDPMMQAKAQEYCDFMSSMAIAIDKDDDIELRRLTVLLERKPGI